MLNHPTRGLIANTQKSNTTTHKLLEQLGAFLNNAETVSRDEWSKLKSESLLEVGDTAADCLSRICSAFRSPDVALSCFRDAGDKLAELNAEKAKRETLEQLRCQFKEQLTQEILAVKH
ncbi:MAG TPA: hypothetical protein VIQ31_18840 [Phormidium sp.]